MLIQICTNRISKVNSFDIKGKGNLISLTAEKLKEAAKKSIGIHSTSDKIQIKHLVRQIKLIEEQIEEIEKNRRALQTNKLSYLINPRDITLLWYFYFI